jgi:hypothetical protein
MDLANQWDRKYCLSKFNRFVLSSTEISDDSQLAKIVKFKDPRDHYTNPEVTFIAEANEVVVTSNCKLSNVDSQQAYTKNCLISL